MAINDIVDSIKLWDDYKGINFKVELVHSRTKESVMDKIVRELGNMYSAFDSTLEEVDRTYDTRVFNLKNDLGQYRATIVVEAKRDYTRNPPSSERIRANDDFPSVGPRTKKFQNYWVRVPSMQDESKRSMHARLIADYLERGPIAIDSYRFTQQLKKQVG
jgi:hypothetical protein